MQRHAYGEGQLQLYGLQTALRQCQQSGGNCDAIRAALDRACAAGLCGQVG